MIQMGAGMGSRLTFAPDHSLRRRIHGHHHVEGAWAKRTTRLYLLHEMGSGQRAVGDDQVSRHRASSPSNFAAWRSVCVPDEIRTDAGPGSSLPESDADRPRHAARSDVIRATDVYGTPSRERARSSYP